MREADLQYNAVVPFKDATMFAPIHATFDAEHHKHAIFVFNDTPQLTTAHDFERAMKTALNSTFGRHNGFPLFRAFVAVHAVMCGVVTEGWLQYTHEVRMVFGNMVGLYVHGMNTSDFP